MVPSPHTSVAVRREEMEMGDISMLLKSVQDDIDEVDVVVAKTQNELSLDVCGGVCFWID